MRGSGRRRNAFLKTVPLNRMPLVNHDACAHNYRVGRVSRRRGPSNGCAPQLDEGNYGRERCRRRVFELSVALAWT